MTCSIAIIIILILARKKGKNEEQPDRPENNFHVKKRNEKGRGQGPFCTLPELYSNIRN
jgi:hypothetical protein